MTFYFNTIRQAEELAEFICDLYKSEGNLPVELVGTVRYSLEQKTGRLGVVVAFFKYLNEHCPEVTPYFTTDEYSVAKKTLLEGESIGKLAKVERTWREKKAARDVEK